MTKEFDVTVSLYDGSTLFADSREEAIEEATGKCWKSKKVSAITVRDPETAKSRELKWRS